MKMEMGEKSSLGGFKHLLVCPDHHVQLDFDTRQDEANCQKGCVFPRIRGVYRFVRSEDYASAFGLQWNYFGKTQLDSHTRLPISADRLTRIAGGSLEAFRGKRVLEAGCGAGRFTEIMLRAGASVFACDLSHAVEANHKNCGDFPGHFVCQSDILHLPVLPGQFDIVVGIGFIQHTSDPGKTIAALCLNLRPGGWLLIDHYSHAYPVSKSRKKLRNFLLKRSPRFALRFVRTMVGALWPLHVGLFKARRIRGLGRLRNMLLACSPVVDYHYAYPQLGSKLLHQWAFLDTFDTLTDRFKHLRSKEEIEEALRACGMADIRAWHSGNGIESCSRKPLPR